VARLIIILFIALKLPLLVSYVGGSVSTYKISDHYNGKYFNNHVVGDKHIGDLLRFGLGSLTKPEQWPDWVEVQPQQVPHERVVDGISVTFINHASFLVQVGGVNILTDPIYSDRASPTQWAGPKRVHDPGIRFEDLPPIDVILISHNHYDHLDADTLKRFAKLDGELPLVLSGLGNSRFFDELGFTKNHEMDWEDSLEYADLEFVFSECQHRSGRGIVDQMTTLWGSFIIKTPAGNIYFAGDTGYSPHFKDSGLRHGPFALALLPIGAYEPRWFMKDVHVNPMEAVQAHRDLRSEYSLGMHFGTFQLTYEAIDQPSRDLATALTELDVDPEHFQIIAPGDTREINTATPRY